jgi:hypothetical protein
MPFISAFLLILIALGAEPEPVVLEAPDSAIVQRLDWAQAELDRAQLCEPADRCHDVVVNALALTSLGRFDLVRPGLVRAMERTPLWVLAGYDYWAASGDHAFAREQWQFISHTLFADGQQRADDDGAVRLAALNGVMTMARVRADSAVLARAESMLAAAEIRTQQRPGVFGAALALINADRADAHLVFLEDTMHARWPLATGLLALGFYEYHRGAEAFALLRRMAARKESSAAMFVLPLIRGLIGWEVDAPNRALAVEPHLPASWTSFSVSNLVAGAEIVDIRVQREPRSFTMQLTKRSGAPWALRLSPALPRGARITAVTVNEADAPIQIEETEHDTHVVIETTLRRDVHIEIEYEVPRARRVQ